MPRRKVVSLGGRAGAAGHGHEDATPERLRHALNGGEARVDAQGIRRLGDPFDVLHARHLLDREDPEMNALLWQAGDRLRGHWHLSRLDPLTAFDFRRESVDGGRAVPTGPAEAAVRHREALRRARDAVGPRLLPYLTGVVVDGRTVADLRGLVTDTGHARTAEALALDRLREALHRLCDLWRLHPGRRHRPLQVWRDGDHEG
jgi:hypothetical protein